MCLINSLRHLKIWCSSSDLWNITSNVFFPDLCSLPFVMWNDFLRYLPFCPTAGRWAHYWQAWVGRRAKRKVEKHREYHSFPHPPKKKEGGRGNISIKEALSGSMMRTQLVGLRAGENGSVCWLSSSFSFSLHFFSCSPRRVTSSVSDVWWV